MDNREQPYRAGARPPARALRCTFYVTPGDIRLEKVERLNVVSPPAVGQRPQAGKNSGFWVELRGPRERVLAHRVLQFPLGDSVEVHSPDGKIERRFGPISERRFEVLLPDEPEARSVALIGEYRTTEERDSKERKPARELARFDLPGVDRPNPKTSGGRP